MASAAARGANLAKKMRKKKLLARTQHLTEHSLDKEQRRSLFDHLRENENTQFLTLLLEGHPRP
jgi:hypothetical protein